MFCLGFVVTVITKLNFTTNLVPWSQNTIHPVSSVTPDLGIWLDCWSSLYPALDNKLHKHNESAGLNHYIFQDYSSCSKLYQEE